MGTARKGCDAVWLACIFSLAIAFIAVADIKAACAGEICSIYI